MVGEGFPTGPNAVPARERSAQCSALTGRVVGRCLRSHVVPVRRGIRPLARTVPVSVTAGCAAEDPGRRIRGHVEDGTPDRHGDAVLTSPVAVFVGRAGTRRRHAVAHRNPVLVGGRVGVTLVAHLYAVSRRDEGERLVDRTFDRPIRRLESGKGMFRRNLSSPRACEGECPRTPLGGEKLPETNS